MSTASYNIPESTTRSHSRLGTTMPKHTRFDVTAGGNSMMLPMNHQSKFTGIDATGHNSSLMRGSWAGRQG